MGQEKPDVGSEDGPPAKKSSLRCHDLHSRVDDVFATPAVPVNSREKAERGQGGATKVDKKVGWPTPLPITASRARGLTAVQWADSQMPSTHIPHPTSKQQPFIPLHARLPRPPDTAVLHPRSRPSRRPGTILWVAAMSC